ncbi:tRNA epoxyqueuosine(34) reductase QueG [Desulfosporosinus youngiae]|nr:tRNA epoxyqueuosine(34) reductase QueG [Desulfosporosinus youngiae]
MDIVEQTQWKMNIKRWARELGFVSVGFTAAEPIDSLASLLQTRIDQGLMTPFESKVIEQRIDPQAVWQDCRTVAALAFPLPLTVPPQEGEGVMARSAVGEDYHRVIVRKINQLIDRMVNHGWPGFPRFQVDTGPLVERAFALRAGIGWIGRNQHLIIPGYGSFAALALLLLDQEIRQDDPLIPGQCGTCQKCVQACPARIIGQEPFAAKKCVSYLTQSKEVLTSEERHRLGLRIFGCDTCQEVCPHNQKRLEEEALAEDPGLCPPAASTAPAPFCRGVNLYEILNLSKGEFIKRYKATAAGWRGKGVLQRNAFLALRNAQDARSEQWLAEREKDKSVPPVILPYIQDGSGRCE